MAPRTSAGGGDNCLPTHEPRVPPTSKSEINKLKRALQKFVHAAIDDSPLGVDAGLDQIGTSLSYIVAAAVEEKVQALKFDEKPEEPKLPGNTIRLHLRVLNAEPKKLSGAHMVLSKADITDIKDLQDAIKALSPHPSFSNTMIQVFHDWTEVQHGNLQQVLKEAHTLDFTAGPGIEVFVTLPKNPPRWTEKLSVDGRLMLVVPISCTVAELRKRIHDLFCDKDGADFTPPSSALSLKREHALSTEPEWADQSSLAVHAGDWNNSRVYVSITTYYHAFAYGTADKWFGRGNSNVFDESKQALNVCHCATRIPHPSTPTLRGTSAGKEKCSKLSREELIEHLALLEDFDSDPGYGKADDESTSYETSEMRSYIDSHAETVDIGWASGLSKKEKAAIKALEQERERIMRGDVSTSSLGYRKDRPLTPEANMKIYNRPFAESVASDHNSLADEYHHNGVSTPKSRLQVTPQLSSLSVDKAKSLEETPKLSQPQGKQNRWSLMTEPSNFPHAVERHAVPTHHYGPTPSPMVAPMFGGYAAYPNAHLGWPSYMQPNNPMYMSAPSQYMTPQQSFQMGCVRTGDGFPPRRFQSTQVNPSAARDEYFERLGKPTSNYNGWRWYNNDW